MDLTRLLARFPPDRPPAPGGTTPGVAAVVEVLGGVTLDGGLYRVLPADQVASWTVVAAEAFPHLADRITVFGADWLGRLIAADGGRRDDAGEPLVLLLDAGAGEALEVPVTPEQVHTDELLEAADALVAEAFYREWRATSGDARPLRLDECVGYRVPLFLGGADDVENLERTDLEVHWSLSAQSREQTAALSDGTRITGATGG